MKLKITKWKTAAVSSQSFDGRSGTSSSEAAPDDGERTKEKGQYDGLPDPFPKTRHLFPAGPKIKPGPGGKSPAVTTPAISNDPETYPGLIYKRKLQTRKVRQRGKGFRGREREPAECKVKAINPKSIRDARKGVRKAFKGTPEQLGFVCLD